MHLSIVAEQFTQLTPPVPQVVSLEAWQRFMESQQPLAHDVASHTHMPDEQCCPLEHPTHAMPPVPHVELDELRQLADPSQQPDRQEVPLHTQLPPWHCWPVAQATVPPDPQTQAALALQVSVRPLQATQAAPPAPQFAALGEKQLPPWQHPAHPVVVLHTQLPDKHWEPTSQTPPFPQRH
jgi:hypothetical protein